MTTIKFGEYDLPVHPFIWIYGQYMLPLESVKCNIDDDVKDQIKSRYEFNKLLCITKRYNGEYWTIRQRALSLDNVLNISFHTWLYHNRFGKNDMTAAKFKQPLGCGIFELQGCDSLVANICGEKDEFEGIAFNCMEYRLVSVHNTRLSPKNHNSFKIIDKDKDKDKDKDNKDNDKDKDKCDDRMIARFISVVFCHKLKRVCTVLHEIII